MSDQTNPTADETREPDQAAAPEEETTQEEVTQETGQEVAAPAADESAAQVSAPTSQPEPAGTSSAVAGSYARDEEGEAYDEEGGDYEEEDEEEEDDGLYVEGPAEYVQRERSGRGRRVGGEVRPDDVDYKNVPLLSRFLDRRGRILSRRKTRVTAKVQRRIVKAIKRARHLSLLPYTGEHTRVVRKRGR